ncbi:F-box domain containing protein [Trema orientale]|uniref:F-box domain containing protein n=1 Tax=Trema orientale TaxID=63057 RepID=A0A2P5CUQ9_TREOI|nr:F-box domain containing protein [Trema orientale]
MEEHDHHNQNNTGKRITELPLGVIENIFLRLPVKSLMILSCVCREWNSLIQNRVFIEQHMKRATPRLVGTADLVSHPTTTARPFRCTVLTRGYWGFPTWSVRQSLAVRILSVSEGLLVERHFFGDFHLYVVRNPATCKVLALRHPPGEVLGMWLKVFLSTGEAKLLCKYSVLMPGNIREENYAILEIGRDIQIRNTWRLLPNRTAQSLMVSVDQEKMYFIIRVWTAENGFGLRISSFDIRTEETVADYYFPIGVFPDVLELHPFWWDNCLAFGNVTERELQALVLEKQGNQYNWIRKDPILGFLGHLMCKLFVPIEVKSTDLWYHTGINKYCYCMETSRFKECRLLEDGKTFEYRPSLMSLEGMGPASR